MHEDLSDVHLFAAAEFGRMLFVISANLRIGRRRDVARDLGDQLLPPHLIPFFDDRRTSFGAHRGGDLFGWDLHAVGRRVLRQHDFLDVLIEHGAGDLGTNLGQIGARVAVEIALEVPKVDQSFTDARDHVRRRRGLSMAGQSENGEKK